MIYLNAPNQQSVAINIVDIRKCINNLVILPISEEFSNAEISSFKAEYSTSVYSDNKRVVIASCCQLANGINTKNNSDFSRLRHEEYNTSKNRMWLRVRAHNEHDTFALIEHL